MKKTKTAKKRIPAYVKQIQQSNKRFAGMNKSQRKIAVAKEVLMLLKTKEFVAEGGTYCNVIYKNPLDEKLDLQKEIFKGNVEKCKVCAMGAIFMAKVKVADGFKESDTEGNYSSYMGDDEIIENLRGVFTEKELRAIEYAFEGSYMGDGFEHEIFTQKENDAVQKFYVNNWNTSERMAAIMQNVIDNKGKFVISKLK